MAASLMRPRIGELIETRLGKSVCLLDAASGSGKTVALREQAKYADTIYLAVSERASFARFAADLAQAFRAQVPGIQQTLAGAFERGALPCQLRGFRHKVLGHKVLCMPGNNRYQRQ